MPRKVQVWCDQCGTELLFSKLVQWPACRETKWRTLDFCSHQCADSYRAAMTATTTPSEERGEQ